VTRTPTARQQAALAGHRGDAATARRLSRSDDPAVRDTALGALARADSLTLDDLHRAAADRHPRVRRRAAELAATFAFGDDVPFLVPLLADDDPSVAEMAAWAAGERTPPETGAVAALAAMATGHDDALCREAAVAALGALGDDAGLPAILAALADKPAVRRRAVIALAPFDGPDVDEALRRALDDRDRQVRQAAEDQLPADRRPSPS
jgi:HEAT repeat protein